MKKEETQFIKGLKQYKDNTLKIVLRKQMQLIKSSILNVTKLTFAKAKYKTNYIINSVFESINTKVRISYKYKDTVRNEFQLI